MRTIGLHRSGVSVGLISFLGALVLVCASTRTEAGAWTQPKGQGFYKLGSQMVRGGDFVEVDGNALKIPTLADYTVSVYGEYGLRDDLTLVAYVPLFKRITLNKQVGRPSNFVYFGGEAVNGVADADLGLRYRVWQRSGTVLSAGLNIGVPLGDEHQANGLLTGDGEMNQQLTLQLGRSLYPMPAYLNASIGFNNRVEGYSDEFQYGLEFGYTLNALTAIAIVRGTESFENGDSGVSGGMGGLFANDQRFLNYGPELVYALGGGTGVAVSALLSARVRNALAAPKLSIGVFTKR